jgi:hypothetical protein
MLKVQNSANGEDLMPQFEEGDVRPFDDRGKYERTTLMYVVNHVPTAAIKICFMEATCRYKLRAPYIKDTGVFIPATNLPPGQNIKADPWDTGGRNAPIAATAGSCRLTVILAPGVEHDVPLDAYPEAGEGKFYPSMGWQITRQPSVSITGDNVITIQATRIPSGVLDVATSPVGLPVEG